MKKHLPLILIALIVIAVYFATQSPTVNDKDKKAAEDTVSLYYDSLSQKQYDKALSLIDYKSDEDYSNDLKSLSSNQDYTVTLPPDQGGWVRTENYEKRNKTYIVEAVAQIKYVNYEWVANEIAYVKKVRGNYKIEKIITNDKYYKIRESKMAY